MWCKKGSQQGLKQLLNKKYAPSCINTLQAAKGVELYIGKTIPLFASEEAIGI